MTGTSGEEATVWVSGGTGQRARPQRLLYLIIHRVELSGKHLCQLFCDILKAAVALCRRGKIRCSPMASMTRWRTRSARSDDAVRANENSTLICLRYWLRSRSIRAAE